jgi:hypothetical protein
MHVNQILVQCLEITMDHSLPQVELDLKNELQSAYMS